jgi:glycosyltransferase involved in cell wall biosynthesis
MVGGIRYVRRGGYSQSTSIKRDLVQCLIYALKTAWHVPSGDVVVTNDFWMPAVLPWLKPSVGRIVVNANRFPKKQYWLYSKCAAFAAVSGAVAAALKAQTPSAVTRVAIVPNAIDDAFLKPTAPRNAQDKLRILYIGRIHPEKGLGLLAKALKSRLLAPCCRLHAPWECVLVGPVAEAEGGGGEAFVAELKREMEGLPVRFEAPVFDPEALAKIYDKADVFVYPSVAETGESFGIAPLEAMARGVVPVVSDLAVFREYLESGANGVAFNHRNGQGPADLARVLNDLVSDADKRARLGAAARATAEKFSPAAIADKYLQLFEKVVSGT